MLLTAFVLFALMLLSWFVAPSAEKRARVTIEKPATSAAPAGAAMSHQA